MFSLDLLSAIANLDISWFYHMFADNLLWVFIFLIIAFIFASGKKILPYFLIVAAAPLIATDWTVSLGWTWTAALFLFIFYATRMFVLVVGEDVEWLKDKLPLLVILQFFAVLVFFNLFMR